MAEMCELSKNETKIHLNRTTTTKSDSAHPSPSSAPVQPSANAQSKPARLKRFIYNEVWEIFLLESIAAARANLSTHSQTTTRNEKSATLLLKAAQLTALRK